MKKSGVTWAVLPAAVLLLVGGLSATTAAPAIADTSGHGGDFFTLPAGSRVLDTRAGTGAPKAKLTAGQTVTVTVLGQAGVPATGVKSLLLHATAIGPSAHSSITFYPHGTSQPVASSLNVPASTAGFDATIEVAPGTNGQVDILNSSGTTDLVVDVAGYYASTTGTPGHGGYVPLAAPVRAVDTRLGVGAPKAKIAAGKTVTATIARSAVPAGVTSFYAEVTVPVATANATIVSYPVGTPTAVGQLAVTTGGTGTGELLRMNSAGQLVFLNSSTVANDIIVDIEGYFASSPTEGNDLHPLQARMVGGLSVAAGATATVKVAGVGGMPTRGVTAALLNFTLSGQTAPGLLTIGGASGWLLNAVTSPTSSFHNSLLMVPLSSTGTISIKNPTSTAETVYVDGQGYYSTDPDTSVGIAEGSAMALTQAVSGGAIDGAYINNSGTLLHGSAALDAIDQATWTPVPSNLEAFTGRPSIAKLSGTAGALQVALLHASDGQVWTFTVGVSSQSTWAAPAYQHTGGIMTGSPATANLPDGSPVIFDIDADGALWSLPANGSWTKLGGPGLAGSPTAVTTTNGIQLVARTTAGSVQTVLYSNGVLGSWTDLNDTGASSDVAAMMNQGPRLRVVVGQADGTVLSKLQNINGSFPATWTQLGTTAASSFAGTPALGIDLGTGTNPGTGRCFVLSRGTDGLLRENIETGQSTGLWGDWSDSAWTASTDATVVQVAGSANNYHWLAGYLDTDGAPRIVHS